MIDSYTTYMRSTNQYDCIPSICSQFSQLTCTRQQSQHVGASKQAFNSLPQPTMQKSVEKSAEIHYSDSYMIRSAPHFFQEKDGLMVYFQSNCGWKDDMQACLPKREKTGGWVHGV